MVRLPALVAVLSGARQVGVEVPADPLATLQASQSPGGQGSVERPPKRPDTRLPAPGPMNRGDAAMPVRQLSDVLRGHLEPCSSPTGLRAAACRDPSPDRALRHPYLTSDESHMLVEPPMGPEGAQCRNRRTPHLGGYVVGRLLAGSRHAVPPGASRHASRPGASATRRGDYGPPTDRFGARFY